MQKNDFLEIISSGNMTGSLQPGYQPQQHQQSVSQQHQSQQQQQQQNENPDQQEFEEICRDVCHGREVKG